MILDLPKRIKIMRGRDGHSWPKPVELWPRIGLLVLSLICHACPPCSSQPCQLWGGGFSVWVHLRSRVVLWIPMGFASFPKSAWRTTPERAALKTPLETFYSSSRSLKVSVLPRILSPPRKYLSRSLPGFISESSEN